jgi:uncharacterized membrane protein YccC
MPFPPAQAKPSSRSAFACAMSDWARTDGLAWIHVFKTVSAALLALLIAMRLDLPQPRTAMTTVFIVMLPQSGMVIAKSFYRLCGTMVGLIVMLVLVALFSQQRVLFLSSTAVWVGICTAGAARNRHFKSYGFVLAGYTAALIGIPAAQQPDGAFLSAMTRAVEVTLGIACSGAVSALVFPQYAGEQIRTTIRARFVAFVDFVASSLAGEVGRSQNESMNAAFVADIVGFEAVRSVAVLEEPEARMRRGRLARLNGEFMSASTRFHALQQLMNRLRANSSETTIEALDPYFNEIAPLLRKAGQPILNAKDAAHAADQLDAFKASLPGRVRTTRAGLAAAAQSTLIEFDTATELLYRFVDELHAYAQTYASLAAPSHERERWVQRYVPKTSLLAAAVAGLRAVLATLAVSVFWLASAWPSGATMVLIVATVCALASSSATPTRIAMQMAIGTALAVVAGFVVTFVLYPKLDGFILLSAALTPFLMLGAYLSTLKRTAGVGVGYCIFFCFLAGPDNVIQYDPAAFLNNAIALFVGMVVVAVAFAVIFPTDAPWLRRLLLSELRAQVVAACFRRLDNLGNRFGSGFEIGFESGTRDLFSQIVALSGAPDDSRQQGLQWLFAVLEIGHAVIDIRNEIHLLRLEGRDPEHAKFRASVSKSLDAIARLFDRPTEARAANALRLTDQAIDSIARGVDLNSSSSGECKGVRRILSQLHFIRSALLDPQSPLAVATSGPHRQHMENPGAA